MASVDRLAIAASFAAAGSVLSRMASANCRAAFEIRQVVASIPRRLPGVREARAVVVADKRRRPLRRESHPQRSGVRFGNRQLMSESEVGRRAGAIVR